MQGEGNLKSCLFSTAPSCADSLFHHLFYCGELNRAEPAMDLLRSMAKLQYSQPESSTCLPLKSILNPCPCRKPERKTFLKVFSAFCTFVASKCIFSFSPVCAFRCLLRFPVLPCSLSPFSGVLFSCCW